MHFQEGSRKKPILSSRGKGLHNGACVKQTSSEEPKVCSPIPKNAEFYLGDDQNLTSNTKSKYSEINSDEKCEWKCEGGYLLSQYEQVGNSINCKKRKNILCLNTSTVKVHFSGRGCSTCPYGWHQVYRSKYCSKLDQEKVLCSRSGKVTGGIGGPRNREGIKTLGINEFDELCKKQ